MRKIENVLGTIILVALLMFTGIFTRQGALAGPAAPLLGTAASFAVLAGSTATNTGATTINGDLGVSPGTAVTGFPPGIVSGGAIHAADAVALQAQTDLTTAYNSAAGQSCNTNLSSQDLGGMTLVPGVYCFDSSAQLTGALTLNAEGDPNAIFIFKIGSTLTSASDASIVFINGANPCNVYWQVGSSATLGTGTSFAGNILALTSITLNTGANVAGRVLARNGAVTMDTNSIRFDQCSAAPTFTPDAANETATSAANATATSAATTAPTSAPTSAPTNAPTAEATAAPTGAPEVTPTSTTTSTTAVVGLPATGGAAPIHKGGSAPQPSLVMPTPAQPLNFERFTNLINIDLNSGPVNLPLELWIPALQLNAPILGVGITSKNVMDAPGGSPEDSVWQKAFWYRGSGVPGDLGTATIAGHVIDILGRDAIFANLKTLKTGNLIIVHDTRNGLNVRFLVVKTEFYSVQQASDPSVLALIYGIGPVSGLGPQPASDGRSHLTLITCGGDWVDGSYDSRLVVYAERLQTTLKEKQVGAERPRLNRFIYGLIW